MHESVFYALYLSCVKCVFCASRQYRNVKECMNNKVSMKLKFCCLLRVLYIHYIKLEYCVWNNIRTLNEQNLQEHESQCMALFLTHIVWKCLMNEWITFAGAWKRIRDTIFTHIVLKCLKNEWRTFVGPWKPMHGIISHSYCMKMHNEWMRNIWRNEIQCMTLFLIHIVLNFF